MIREAIISNLKLWLTDFIHLFFPPRCAACDIILQEEEQCLCTKCLQQIPRTLLHQQKENPIEYQLRKKFRIRRGTAFFYYKKEKRYDELVHLIKYKGKCSLGHYLGQLMADELMTDDFFRNIDLIIPVPLHPKRKRQRGYNQSETIAHGVSKKTGIPLNTTALIRTKYNDTQVHHSYLDRLKNVQDSFQVVRPEELREKHLLLIDDVLTTGATITACIQALSTVEGIRISVLTLSAVKRY